MKHLIYTLLLIFSAITLIAAGETQIVILSDGDLASSDQETYSVPVGYVATLKAWVIEGSTASIRVGGNDLLPQYLNGELTVPAGTFISVNASSSDANSLAYAMLLVAPIEAGSNYLPQNTVVIPTDASGDVEIILECSTDLITWTPCSPGTYGTSTAQRFFRVRAEVSAD